MLKGDSIWLAELGADRYPWAVDGYKIRLVDNNDPDLDCLSETDVECLDLAFARSTGLTFNERTAATHGTDWQAAELGMIRYEDMIEADKKDSLVPFLRDNARLMRL